MGLKHLLQCLQCLRDKEHSCPFEVDDRPDFVTSCKFYQPSSEAWKASLRWMLGPEERS